MARSAGVNPGPAVAKVQKHRNQNLHHRRELGPERIMYIRPVSASTLLLRQSDVRTSRNE
eukprot:3804051-Rhodomonas_salina.3